MGPEEKDPPELTPLQQRVKVYRLSDDGKWDDRGTGHVTVGYMERTDDLGLFVIDEEDNDTLLVHRISLDDIYRRQEDTIISWRDPEFSTDLALSFQESTGCSFIWDHICNVQRNVHFGTLCNLGPESSEALETSGASRVNGEASQSIVNDLREFPSVELSTLPLIMKLVVESGVSDQMRLVELILHDQDFFLKLMDLFRTCEDLESIADLHMIFKIVKGIIMLNSTQIFEKMFGDDFIMDVIGCLEYDPDIPQIQNHRAFLKDHVVFKEAIPIKDSLVLSKIHQTYRVGYIKDVILPRVLDEGTISNLNSIIHGNNAVVVSLLKDDTVFIKELFARLNSPTASGESKTNLVMFLQEFCSLSKSLQLVQQLRLFRDLVSEGIFDIITDVLKSQDKRLVLTGTDILLLFLNQDPNLLRAYVIQQEGNAILGLLVRWMLTDFGDDMHCQFLEIMRILMDSYTLSGSQRDVIVEVFYDKYLDQLLNVVVVSCPLKSMERSNGKVAGFTGTVEIPSPAKPEILLNICELLCFCVLHHPYRSKCNFLLNNVIERVLSLTRRREGYLVLAAVRFMRTIISRSDDHLLRHVIKNNLMKPIVEAFVRNGNRYNLLQSAILELFEYVRKENLKTMILHIVENFWNLLAKFENFDAVHALKIKYEQLLETCETRNNVTMVDSRKRVDDRALDKEEEDYFNDSDEEDSASARTSYERNQVAHAPPNGTSSRAGAVGLVDYDDDDDDEDYKPPSPAIKQEALAKDDNMAISSRFKRRSPSLSVPDDEEVELTKKHRPSKNLNCRAINIAAPCSTVSHVDTSKEKDPFGDEIHAPSPCSTVSHVDTSKEKDPFGDEIHSSDEHELDPDASRKCSSSSPDPDDVRQTEPQVSHSSSEVPSNGQDVANSEPYSVR